MRWKSSTTNTSGAPTVRGLSQSGDASADTRRSRSTTDGRLPRRFGRAAAQAGAPPRPRPRSVPGRRQQRRSTARLTSAPGGWRTSPPKHGLTRPRRADHQREPSLLPPVQPVQQSGSMHEPGARPGEVNFEDGKRGPRPADELPLRLLRHVLRSSCRPLGLPRRAPRPFTSGGYSSPSLG